MAKFVHDCQEGYDLGALAALDRAATALRRRARAHERLARLRSSPALRWWNEPFARYHEGAADALETMADRIERGEA